MKYVMNYIDEDIKQKKDLWIERGKVRYTQLPSERNSIITLNTSKFDVFPGRITLDEHVGEAYNIGEGDSYIKRLLLYGFTSFIHRIDMEYVDDCSPRLKESRKSLQNCPLDYIHAVRIPLLRLSDSWMRKLRQESIPIIFFSVTTADELESIAWERLIEAMFPLRLLLVCEPSQQVATAQEKKEISKAWSKLVKKYRFNTFLNFPQAGYKISSLLAKRIGLYPRKGSLVTGSDADYIMFLEEEYSEEPISIPSIIVIKGEVVKVGGQWNLTESKGRELRSLIPERFLPIEDINRFQDN